MEDRAACRPSPTPLIWRRTRLATQSLALTFAEPVDVTGPLVVAVQVFAVGMAALVVVVAVVFGSSANAPQELFKLTASNGDTQDYFGSHVSMSGELAIIGAFNHDVNGTDSGVASVFSVTSGQEGHRLKSNLRTFSSRSKKTRRRLSSSPWSRHLHQLK